jgi:hypothetical protein
MSHGTAHASRGPRPRPAALPRGRTAGLFVFQDEMTRQQSQRLKGLFLEHFAVYGNVTAAAEAAGIKRNTVYVWQERDDQFVQAYREAEIKATEILEAEARRRAVEGVVTETPMYSRKGELLHTAVETKYSDTLLMFLLRARAPEKYRERFDFTTQGQPMIKEVAGVDLGAVL